MPKLWVNLEWQQYLKQVKMQSERRDVRKGLSGGVKFGPPPKKGPNPQGIKIMRSSNGKKRLRKSTRKK